MKICRAYSKPWGWIVAAAVVAPAAVLASVSVEPVVHAGHGTWHHNRHYSSTTTSKSWAAHASSSQTSDLLGARILVRTESTGAIHGDQSVVCSGSEACSSVLTPYVSHQWGHTHEILGFLCGMDGSHTLPDDGYYQAFCNRFVDLHYSTE
jgi:hypothetical protein